MINSDRFSILYITLFRHRTCTYLHGGADRLLVLVSNGQVAAPSDWAYTGMFPVGDPSCGTLIAVCVSVCVCVSADISLNCAKND